MSRSYVDAKWRLPAGRTESKSLLHFTFYELLSINE